MYYDTCYEKFQNASLCGPYFFEELNKVRTTFNNYTSDHLDKIKTIQDPILRHVSLYLVDNYEQSKEYFIKNGTRNNNIACQMLNRWLDQRKSFYTHADKCTANTALWKETIDPIWEMLNKNESKNCTRTEIYARNSYIPEMLLPPTCYKYVPENYKCIYPLDLFKKVLRTKCKEIDNQCSKCKKENYISEYIPNENDTVPVTCPTDTYEWHSSSELQTSCVECPSEIIPISLSIFVTFFATLLILLFLYMFTPLGSKLSNGGRKKKRLQQQFMEEVAHAEFERSRNNNLHSRNKRSKLHYQYVQN
ncbi:VIR protein [Plasmodium vivax]|uniref:VIR protein n=1 Tax=Plasmodium vivax TaxID=5855 RepID=A0A1G4HC48_PLAVI|nr:VIR protein [Plasmodium vivax]